MSKKIYQLYIDFLMFKMCCWADGDFSWLGVGKKPRIRVTNVYNDIGFLVKYKSMGTQ
jgi:hypothetical protein